MLKFKYFIVFSLIFISCKNDIEISKLEFNLINEVDSLFEMSNNKSNADSLRKNSLKKAGQVISSIENDSLRTNLNLKLAYNNLLIGNIENFKNINLKILDDSSLKIDHSDAALVNEYLGYYYQISFVYDSAFYYYNKALKENKVINNSISEGRIFLNMATIQESAKDYTGCEINAIKAISKLTNSKQYRSLYLAHNLLGVVYKNLNSLNLSINSYKEAIGYLKKYGSNKSLLALSLNNIGRVYSKKEDYQESIIYFKKALDIENLFEIDPGTYAMLLNNLAYSRFKLGDETELPELFYKSLKIRDSLQIFDGITAISLNLSEYFLFKNDSTKAFDYAKNAQINAVKSNYNEALLVSYLQLSKLEAGENGKNYLNKYIKLSDSLQQKEREIREKFTRIAYETDEITQEKEAESKKKWWVILFSGIGTSFSILLFINMKQRSKNKELLFNQKQEEYNIEIYNLMLSQQEMFQKGSENEKNRISEELHDGILGRLFGTRLSLDSLNEGKTKADIKEREEYIEELQLIEEDVRTIAHNLKASIFNSETNFMKLVEQLVAKQSKIGKFECEPNFNNLTNWEGISNNIKINCYRILQESIQNINKYASASKVQIDFKKVDNNILMNIHDNGVGFNTKKKNKGIGLKNMRSRAEAINSKIEFNSSQGSGTRITMTIPI
ncbi:MAG: tetratricopeptide repeat-containing sensor histidine kinase [Lutibacter sp.]